MRLLRLSLNKLVWNQFSLFQPAADRQLSAGELWLGPSGCSPRIDRCLVQSIEMDRWILTDWLAQNTLSLSLSISLQIWYGFFAALISSSDHSSSVQSHWLIDSFNLKLASWREEVSSGRPTVSVKSRFVGHYCDVITKAGVDFPC